MRLRLKIGGVGREAIVETCRDCPAYEDPDPYPTSCSLDFSERPREVDVDGEEIPDNCPMLTLWVEVLDNDAGRKDGAS